MAFEEETIFEYLRRQLLLRITGELIANPQKKVTDIALENNFESAPSLNKLFKKLLDCTPSEFRDMTPKAREKAILKLQDPTKRKTMKLKINHTPEFRNRPTTNYLYVRALGKYTETAPGAWQVLISLLTKNNLYPMATEFLGVSYDDPKAVSETSLRYDAAIAVGDGVKAPAGLELGVLEGGKYAVFMVVGPYDQIWSAFDEIFKSWGAENASQLRAAPCLEVYLDDPNSTPLETQRCEVWIPCK
ncbi:DNA gyrase inhibitor [compost metagenome]